MLATPWVSHGMLATPWGSGLDGGNPTYTKQCISETRALSGTQAGQLREIVTGNLGGLTVELQRWPGLRCLCVQSCGHMCG